MYPWFNQAFDQLCRRIEQGKLHHALLLQGIAGIGKAEFAMDLAAYLLCANKQATTPCGTCQACNLFRAGSHPDLHVIESEKQIGVDLIRSVIGKLGGMAQLSGAKVLLMFDAHTMTESSANALLKTLEEPTGNTFLILVTSKPERLLPTILSRCEKLLLPSPDAQQCKRWLASQGFNEFAAELLEIYAGAPLTLVQELQQDGLEYQQFKQGIVALLNQQGNPLELATAWQSSAEKALKWLQHWLSARIKLDVANQDELWTIVQSCNLASGQMINPGINKSLQLAGVLSQIQHYAVTKKNRNIECL
jgi:DNA polymerase-3 subunit delta'